MKTRARYSIRIRSRRSGTSSTRRRSMLDAGCWMLDRSIAWALTGNRGEPAKSESIEPQSHRGAAGLPGRSLKRTSSIACGYTRGMDTRSLLILGIIGFSAAGVMNSIWFGLELKRFVDRTPVLASHLDMMRFKKVVSHQMHAALFQIVLLSAPIVIFITGMMFEFLTGSDILLVVVPSVIILIVGVIFRKLEMRAKTMPTASPEIGAERDAIVRTWLRKPLPDW